MHIQQWIAKSEMVRFIHDEYSREFLLALRSDIYRLKNEKNGILILFFLISYICESQNLPSPHEKNDNTPTNSPGRYSVVAERLHSVTSKPAIEKGILERWRSNRHTLAGKKKESIF